VPTRRSEPPPRPRRFRGAGPRPLRVDRRLDRGCGRSGGRAGAGRRRALPAARRRRLHLQRLLDDAGL